SAGAGELAGLDFSRRRRGGAASIISTISIIISSPVTLIIALIAAGLRAMTAAAGATIATGPTPARMFIASMDGSAMAQGGSPGADTQAASANPTIRGLAGCRAASTRAGSVYPVRHGMLHGSNPLCQTTRIARRVLTVSMAAQDRRTMGGPLRLAASGLIF